MKRHLIFTPDRNTDGNDFKGAFEPESERYARFWMGEGDVTQLVRVDVSQRSRARAEFVWQTLRAQSAPIDRFVLFCHGWTDGVQFGFSSKPPRVLLARLAEELVRASTEQLGVALYCCSTGKGDDATGDGGFADALRDCLCLAGRPHVSVFAHSTAGHTARNENIRYFLGEGSAIGRRGGVDPIARGTPAFARLDARLHDKADSLRWRLPYLTPEVLRAELGA